MHNGIAARERGHRRASREEKQGRYLGHADICVCARCRVLARGVVQAEMQG